MEISEIQPELYKRFKKLANTHGLSHAYLFSGDFGNTELAFWLAKAIFCPNVSLNGNPCGNCRVCRLIDSNDFTDLHVISPDGQSIKIDQIRELIESFATTGFESRKKVVIIHEAEKMGAAAANSILKSIEEPERETFIFLLTNNENRILPTIRSRTQLVIFPKNTQVLTDLLQKKGMLLTDARLISEVASSVEEALQLMESTWFLKGSKCLEKFVDEAQIKPDDAFLNLPVLIGLFEDRVQQEKAFELLLIFFNRVRAIQLIQKVFTAQRYWRSNVRFQSALESILL